MKRISNNNSQRPLPLNDQPDPPEQNNRRAAPDGPDEVAALAPPSQRPRLTGQPSPIHPLQARLLEQSGHGFGASPCVDQRQRDIQGPPEGGNTASGFHEAGNVSSLPFVQPEEVISAVPKTKEEFVAHWNAWAAAPDAVANEERGLAVEQMTNFINGGRLIVRSRVIISPVEAGHYSERGM